MNQEQKAIIERLNLEAHPEGGYFKETYCSNMILPESNLPTQFKGSRNVATCIYFMLTSEAFSAFHRVQQDETWHFYKGSKILLHMIDESGNYTHVFIGNDFEAGEVPQFTVPKNVWFAAEVEAKEAYALVGCTVAPGFDFRDFELAKAANLKERFPQHQIIISRLTRS